MTGIEIWPSLLKSQHFLCCFTNMDVGIYLILPRACTNSISVRISIYALYVARYLFLFWFLIMGFYSFLFCIALKYLVLFIDSIIPVCSIVCCFVKPMGLINWRNPMTRLELKKVRVKACKKVSTKNYRWAMLHIVQQRTRRHWCILVMGNLVSLYYHELSSPAFSHRGRIRIISESHNATVLSEILQF